MLQNSNRLKLIAKILQSIFPQQWRSNQDATGLAYVEQWSVQVGLLRDRHELIGQRNVIGEKLNKAGL